MTKWGSQFEYETPNSDEPHWKRSQLLPETNMILVDFSFKVIISLFYFFQLISITGSHDLPPMYQMTLWPGSNPNLSFQKRVENKSCSKPSVFS